MKKMIYLLLIVCVGMTIPPSTFAIKENKIIIVGYANYNVLLQKISADNKDIRTIEDMKEDFKNTLAKMTQDIEDLKDKLASGNSGSPQKTITELQKKEIDKQIYEVTQMNTIRNKTNELLGEDIEKLRSIIATKAKQLKFDIIIDSSLVIVPNPQLDLTKIFLASLPR